MKTCTKCGEVKPLDAFSPDKRASDGRHTRCKTCRNGAAKPRCPEYQRDWYLRNKYGLTLAECSAMREAQGNCCAICSKQMDDTTGADGLCVDHCHSTGRVRGLLCNHCNRGLGLFGDSPKILAQAIEYLRVEV